MIISKDKFNKDNLIKKINDLSNQYELLINKKNKLISELKNSQSGILVQEYVKCGKDNCKCSSGDLHGPYWYYYFYENGKLRKKYICPVNKPNKLLLDLQNKIKNNKLNKGIQEEIKLINNKINKINELIIKFDSDISKLLN